jgi:phage baseplate assembly protein W
MPQPDSFTKLGFVDAQSSNESDRSIRQYSDLDLFFVKKVSTKDVNTLKDIQAVKRSVRNLVLLNNYEKPFQPEVGSNISDMLFQPADFVTAIVIRQNIIDVIENFEPRVDLNKVTVIENSSGHGYQARIEFTVLNIEENNQSLEILLERQR